MAHLRKAAQDALAVQLRDNDAPTAFMHNAEAGYERLKEYVRGIRAAGIETLATKLAGGEASRALQEPPLSYLSEDSRFAHEAADAAHVGFNRKIFAEDDFAAKLLSSERFVDADGACHLLPEPNPVIIKESLESYCLIVEAVTRQGSKFVLDGTTLKYKGGWSKEGYQQVNLPSGTVFQCSEQQKVVFAVSKSEVRKFLQDYQLFWLMTHLNGFVESQIGADYSVSLDQLHTLFSFSVYTHFKYHNDQNDLSGDRRKNGVNLTVLVTISPGEASFHVAGRDKEVRYKFPGDIKAFHAGLYHRSGAASFRTVKLAVFCRVFKREEVLFKKEAIDLTPDEADDPPTKKLKSEQGGTSTEPLARVKKEAVADEADDGDSGDPEYKEGSANGEEEESSSERSSKDDDEAAADANSGSKSGDKDDDGDLFGDMPVAAASEAASIAGGASSSEV